MGERFKEGFDLSEKVIHSLEKIGYYQPTDVQRHVIMPVLEGEDLVVQADTGSGKTAGFGIPIVEKVRVKDNAIQALILTPTRELAVQVSKEIQEIGKYKRVRVLPVYGRQNIDIQIHQLKQRIHIVVGTPGRVMDLIEKEHLKLNKLEVLVLDEADELLRRGFLDAIRQILNQLPKKRQTLLFSATMPEEISTLIKEYMRPAKRVEVTSKINENQLIDAFIKKSNKENKIPILYEVIDQLQPKQSLIFCNTKIEVEHIYKAMRQKFKKVAKLHGDLPQKERLKIIDQFKEGHSQYLVATDLAARGLHINALPLVINYELPKDVQNYTHRIGRTGRDGEKGVAVSLVSPFELELLQDIEGYLQKTIPPLHSDYILENNTKPKQQGEIHKKKYPDIMNVRISAGKQKKIRAGDIVGAICNIEGISQEDIGVVDIRERYSYVEIFNYKGNRVIEGLHEQTIKNKVVRVEEAKSYKE